jgi:Flp pilus assembly protein TadG
VKAHEDEGDRGTIALFTTLFAVFVILLAGLLVDGGSAIHARERAADIAEQGARAAANDIDVAYLRQSGQTRILAGGTACDRAVQLVAEFPEVTGRPDCVVSPDQQTATVQVEIKVRLQLLSILPGFSDFTMTSTASANPQAGN